MFAAIGALCAASAGQQKLAGFFSPVRSLSHVRSRPRQGASERKELLLARYRLVNYCLHIARWIRPGAGPGKKFISTQVERCTLRPQHSILVRIDRWAGVRLKRIRRYDGEPCIFGGAG